METLRTEEVAPTRGAAERFVPIQVPEEGVPPREPDFMRHHERVALIVVGGVYALFALFWFRGPAAWLESTGETPFSLLRRFLFLEEKLTHVALPLPLPSTPWMLGAAIPPTLLLLFPARENRRRSFWDFLVAFAAPLGIACFAAGVPFSFVSFLLVPWGLGLTMVATCYLVVAMVQLARGRDRRQFRGRRIGVWVGIWTLATMVLTVLEWVVMALTYGS